MSARPASTGLVSPSSTRRTISEIGISTPRWAASRLTARAVRTPSAT